MKFECVSDKKLKTNFKLPIIIYALKTFILKSYSPLVEIAF